MYDRAEAAALLFCIFTVIVVIATSLACTNYVRAGTPIIEPPRYYQWYLVKSPISDKCYEVLDYGSGPAMAETRCP